MLRIGVGGLILCSISAALLGLLPLASSSVTPSQRLHSESTSSEFQSPTAQAIITQKKYLVKKPGTEFETNSEPKYLTADVEAQLVARNVQKPGQNGQAHSTRQRKNEEENLQQNPGRPFYRSAAPLSQPEQRSSDSHVLENTVRTQGVSTDSQSPKTNWTQIKDASQSAIFNFSPHNNSNATQSAKNFSLFKIKRRVRGGSQGDTKDENSGEYIKNYSTNSDNAHAPSLVNSKYYLAHGKPSSVLSVNPDPSGMLVIELGDNITHEISSVPQYSCWYDYTSQKLNTPRHLLPEVYELEEPDIEAGCQSCELDDDGDPLDKDAEDIGLRPPLPITQEGAAENQLFLEGLDTYVSRSELQKILQSGLLNTDTFSAEDRRRRPLSEEVATCKCQVNVDETVCTLNRGFCDALPKSDVPSGILEVFGTNISYLGVTSLLPYHGVSVMKLGSNQLERIEPGTFSNMTQLRNLSLVYNRLSSLDEEVFQGASNLVELLVSYNKFRNLTQVTRSLTSQITPNLLHLSLGGNRFSSVTREDFAYMKGIPLRDLQLYENAIRHLAKDAFADLRNLTRLRLRHNPLHLSDIRDLLIHMQNTTLEMIDLSGLGMHSIVDFRFVLGAVASTNITALQLNNYCFYSLRRFSIPPLPKLKVLTMSECGLHTIYDGTFNGFTSLTHLDLSNNHFTYVPDAVLLHQLTSLDLSKADLVPGGEFKVHEYKFRSMNNLRSLDLSRNNVQVLNRGSFVGLENLTTLVLDSIQLQYIEEFTFSSLENLSELYLSNNPLGDQDFEFTWPGLTNLQTLLLDNCSIYSNRLYLHEMPKLQLIKMNNNLLQNITDLTFVGLQNLQAVELSHNQIRPWHEKVFEDALNLTRIYLDNNQITWVTPAMVEDIRNAQLLTLRDNPYLCDCQLYDWLIWEEGNTHSINTSTMTDPTTSDVAECTCQLPPQTKGTKVLDYYSKVKLSPCRTTKSLVLFLMIPVFFSGVLVAILTRVLWRNRWYIRYWIFKVTSKRWLKRLRRRPSDYLYDAFVSYSSEDADFVLEMMGQLEKQQPFFRLCVYERDFEIGNVISECILESINTSRKTILVLSDHFAKSHWCRWEMSLVQCRLFEQKRDDLILVKLGKVRSRHLTPTIKYLMRTRIYIEWGPSSQQQMLFWERLRTALRQPSGAPHLPRTV